MSFVLRPPDEIVPLTQRLRGIGRARRLARVAAGLLALVAAVGVAVAAMGALDAWLHLSAGVRAVGLLAVLGLAGTMYVRNVRRPSQESVEPVAVAQFIEAKFPEFNDVLASAASFEGNDDGRTAAKFRRAAVRKAERLTNRHDLAGVVPTGRVWRALAAALGTVLLLGILILPDVGRAGVAAVRLLDPFGDHPWPPKTRIELTGPPALLAKGDPYPVRFVVRGVLPADAVLSVKLVGSPANDEHVPLVREDGATEVAVNHLLLPDRVTRDFEFRVTANDADTGWLKVAVATPPRLTLLDGRPSPQIRLTYQSYTNQRPTDLPDGSGGIETVSGTRVTLKAAADRRIVRAVLHYEGDLAAVRVANDLACLAGTNPLLAPVAPAVSEHFGTDTPVSVNGPEGKFLAADFFPPLSGLYSLRFTDESGLTGVQKLDVRTFPDPAPVVALIRPTPGLDTLLLVPTASINVRARADDRTYAVKKLVLEYRVNDGPLVEIPLADAEAVKALVPPARPQPPDLEAARRFPLAAFLRADGKPPTDGDIITLRAAATDWDDYTLAKLPGRSGEVEIRVMSEESLTAFLQKELAALRPDLSRATAAQKEAADKTQQAKKATTPDGKLTPEGQDKLTQAEQAQKQLRNQLADPRDGLRAKAEKLRDTAKANNLQKSPATQRAEAVARNLADLEEKHLAEIEPQLSAARQGDPTNPKAVPEAIAKAAKNQQAVIEKLTAAAEELEQWAAAAEVRGDARQLKEQVAKTAADAKKTADRLPTGLTPDLLPPEDRAALEKLGNSLEKAAEQAGKLISKADRVAEEKRSAAAASQKGAAAKAAEAKQASADAKAKPEGSADRKAAEAKANALAAEAAALKDAAAKASGEADTLEKAAKDAGRQAIADDLRKAADAQKNNRSGEAAANAKSATDRLQKMTDDLGEKKDDVDELTKKRKDAADRVDQLADQQDELAKKANKANEMPDGDAKAEAMKELAADQEQLRKETEQLSRKLDREGATDAAEQLRRAAKEMEQARDQFADGQDPKAKPDEALERLEDAKQELEKPQPEEKDQLEREQREEFLQQFKTFLEKQKAAVEESERLTKAAVQAKKWERPLQASLSSLGDREKALAKEVRKFADEKTKEAKVFDTMLRQAADQMDKAAERIAERKADVVLADPAGFDAESEAAADETTRRPMRAALRRLEQIVNSLKEDEKKKGGAQPMPMGGGAGQPMPPAGGPMGLRGVPPVAQLKALRDWQTEINDRTAAFAKDHPDREKLSDDDKDELQEIEQAQKDITKLLEEILPLLQEQMGGELP